ncbi:MAG: hypothetical protein KatS3mg112_1832 [Thermogutta sp.]|nr:MAG: hypothetical protein KatS3mg112_1832 [Thermogutta sp.]
MNHLGLNGHLLNAEVISDLAHQSGFCRGEDKLGERPRRHLRRVVRPNQEGGLQRRINSEIILVCDLENNVLRRGQLGKGQAFWIQPPQLGGLS